jgi:molecular chaperone IbpA
VLRAVKYIKYYVFCLGTAIVERDNMLNRNDDFYPPRPEKDWHKKPYISPQDPRISEGIKKPEPPRVLTITDLFPNLGRLSIGWSPILDTLKEVTATKPSYPPYDIVKIDDETNVLNVAVAGFSKKDLTVSVQDSVLKIEGKKKGRPEGEVVYQGIAGRNFTLSLAVAEFWEIKDAKVEDGMLVITFVKELPEEKKPKVIDIK